MIISLHCKGGAVLEQREGRVDSTERGFTERQYLNWISRVSERPPSAVSRMQVFTCNMPHQNLQAPNTT